MLLSIKEIVPGVQLGIWKISEQSVEDFLLINPSLSKILPLLENYRHRARLIEKIAVYQLVMLMTNCDDIEIKHNENGKPYLDKGYISITDTKGYAAVMFSENRTVAIDIEYYSSRVSRIVNKFIRTDEQAETVDIQLVNWSAKETVYKYFSEQNLQYFEMRLHPFYVQKQGIVMVDNLKSGNQSLEVNYQITPDFVLTYAY